MPSFGKNRIHCGISPELSIEELISPPSKAVKISLKLACLDMHVLRFMRKVEGLSSAMEMIWKHVPLEYMASRRRSWRKLDKFEIRFTLFAIICICGT